MIHIKCKALFSQEKKEKQKIINLSFANTVFDLITAHTPISAQSSNSIVFSQCTFFVYKGICYGYSFELHRLTPTTYVFIKKKNLKKKKNGINIIK